MASRRSAIFRLPADEGYRYILLEDLVSLFIGRFFPGETVVEAVPFRITRNADMSVREDEVPDLMAGMEEVLDARKESDCVRLEVADSCSRETLTFLTTALWVDSDFVFPARGPLDLAAFMCAERHLGFRRIEVRFLAAAEVARRGPDRQHVRHGPAEGHPVVAAV